MFGFNIKAFKIQSKRDPFLFPVLKLNIHSKIGSEYINLINGKKAEYIIVPRFGAKNIGFDGNDFEIQILSLWKSLHARLRALTTFKAKKILKFRSGKILFDGPEHTKKLLIRTNKLLTRLRSRLDSSTIKQHPELIIGWGENAVQLAKPREISTPSAWLAIVVHVYYPETWPELAEVLRHISYRYDLFITTVSDRTELIEQMKADFPQAQIKVFENRGRDVRPFLRLLEDGTLAPYDLVCKIHGKRSLANDPSGNLGDICRRRMLFDLLVAPNVIAYIVKRFRTEPKLGMIGSKAFHLNRKRDFGIFWKANFDQMTQIIRELGGGPQEIKPNFFEGTMFWVRRSALNKLAQLKLSECFDAERGANDGALEHALERVFAVAVLLSGFIVDAIDGLNFFDF